MDSSSGGHPAGQCPPGQYAVVAYIPEPLGSYLSALRAELVPGCTLRSHITILPPRRLTAGEQALSAEMERLTRNVAAFEVTLGEVEVFSSTGVIYVALSGGRQSVEQAHAALNHGILFAEDLFPFHPHVTIAQNLGAMPFEQVLEQARRRWQECPWPRHFMVEELVLVRSLAPDSWQDLSRHPLAPVSLLRTA
ncbi:MAG: 2'-5' RNA ligase family protein [Bryobacteraceae bacterium]